MLFLHFSFSTLFYKYYNFLLFFLDSTACSGDSVQTPTGDTPTVEEPSGGSLSVATLSDYPAAVPKTNSNSTTMEKPTGDSSTVEKPCGDLPEKPAAPAVIPCTCCFKEAAQVLCLECVVGLCSECNADHEKSHKVLYVHDAAMEAKYSTTELHDKLNGLLDDDEAQTIAEAAIDERFDSTLADFLAGLDRRRAEGGGRVVIEVKTLLQRSKDLDSRLSAIEDPSTMQALLAHRKLASRIQTQLQDALKMQEKRVASRKSSDQLLLSYIADRFGEQLFSMMNILFSHLRFSWASQVFNLTTLI